MTAEVLLREIVTAVLAVPIQSLATFTVHPHQSEDCDRGDNDYSDNEHESRHWYSSYMNLAHLIDFRRKNQYILVSN